MFTLHLLIYLCGVGETVLIESKLQHDVLVESTSSTTRTSVELRVRISGNC